MFHYMDIEFIVNNKLTKLHFSVIHTNILTDLYLYAQEVLNYSMEHNDEF